MATLFELMNRLSDECLEIHCLEYPVNYVGVEIFNHQEVLRNDILYIIEQKDQDQLADMEEKQCGCIFNYNCDAEPSCREYAILRSKTSAADLEDKISLFICEYIQLEHKKLEILSSISKRNPLQNIVDATARIMGNPIIVSNAAIQLLAYAGGKAEDPIFNKMYDNHKVYDGKTMEFFITKGFLEQLLQHDGPVLFEKAENLPHRRILSKIVINGNYVGSCGASEEGTSFGWDAVLIMQTMVTALQIVLVADYRVMMPRGRESLLSQLLNGDITEKNTLEAWLKSIKWKPKRYFCLCILGEVEPDILNARYSSLQQMTCNLYEKAYLCTYGSYLVVVGNNEDAERNMRCIQQFKKMADMLNVSAVISRNFTQMLMMHSQLVHSLNALEWVRQAYPRGKWIDFDDSYMKGVFRNIEAVESLCHPGIANLNERDKEEETEYIKTLSAFFDCGCNITKTAQILYLHRNTLSNRISKIESLTGIDFGNGRDVFNAQLSLMILEYMEN